MATEQEIKPCLYHRIYLDYRVGLGKIYTEQEIEEAKKSPSFDREYDLKWVGRIGNVFRYHDVENSIGDFSLSLQPNEEAQSMGIDPGFGGSAFGIVITTYRDGKIHILLADEFERPSYEDMREKCWDLIKRFKIKKIYIDGSALSFVKSLKIVLGERANYDTVPKEHYRFMRVQPISFATRHKEMLSYAKSLVEGDYIRIHPTQQKLIIALKTAWEHEGTLDKEQSSYDDLTDAFRLSMLAFKQGEHQQAS